MVKRHFKIWALSLGLILLASGLSLVQEETEQARLEGKVMDVEKKPLSEAEIQLKNVASGQMIAVKSNKKGDFFVRTLFPGKYLLTVSK